VKLQIGGHIFSHCLVDRVETEFLNGNFLTGAEIGIIGLGSIGRGLADIVLRQDNRVVFYDPARDLNVPHYLRDRVSRAESLQELTLRCDYVFGASGRNPFHSCWPMAHRPGIKLFSGSGGDQEFGPIIRWLRERPGFKVAPDSWDVTSDDGPSGPIRIAYLGFPYNFVSRTEAAVPTHIVQIETGGLLAALIEARLYLKLVEDGYEQDTYIHRVSPDAQSFLYERWLQAMNDRDVDIRELYGYDASVLESAKRIDWFAENTEPHSNAGDRLEEMMRSILPEGCEQDP
jgi:hypothetical protein